MKYLFIILFACAFISCDKHATSIEINESSTFTIKEGAYFKVLNFEWYLKNIADSRCPSDVNCVRAGEALVNLVISNADVTRFNLQLCLGPDCNNRPIFYTFSIAGITYKLELISVQPFPKASGNTERKTATFKLVKV